MEGKAKKFVFLLLFVTAIGGCGIIQGPAKPIGEITKDQVIETYFKDKKLDFIEGIWVWENGAYEIAIISNSFDDYRQYDYVGVITDTEQFGWQRGETKLLLKKTASRSAYSASYFMSDKSETEASVLLTNENLLQIWVPGPYIWYEKHLLLRLYPQSGP